MFCVGMTLAFTGCAGPSAPRKPADSGVTPATDSFLRTYVRPDGQVVRLDQGGDTVSEGQAYGMLLAEAAGNTARFRDIWTWTRDHLRLADGLFAYHASGTGHVISRQPASDADVLIAWALLRFSGPGQAQYHAEGRQVARAILEHEVTRGPSGQPVLAAGPWATGRPASLNPSYWSLPALQDIGTITGVAEWHELAATAVAMTQKLTSGGQLLPPDWAALQASGTLRSEPSPSGTQPQTEYSLDAQRVVVWFAASCDPAARALAARWWPLLQPADRSDALALQPTGTVLAADPAVLPLVASAAAAKAANDGRAAQRLLLRAAGQQRSSPTYYGGAWAALGPVLLTGSALGTC